MKLGDALLKFIDNRGKTPPLANEGYELIETTSLAGKNKFPDYARVRKYVSEHTFSNWFRAGHPQKDDILIITVGEIGTVCVMRETRGCIAQNLVGLRVNTQIADPHYLYYYLTWEKTNNALKNLNVGVAQPSLKVPHILEFDITIPSLLAQRHIADILCAYDDLIENNMRRIHILEQMTQTIYQEWIGKVDKESLPEGWSARTFGEISENLDYKRIPVSGIEREKMQGEYPYYGASGIIDYVNDYIFDGRYLLIAEDGENLRSRKTPIAFFAHGKFWVNNHAHIVQAKPPMTLEFLYLFFANQAMSGFITGAAQPKLSQQNLNGIPVVVPSPDLMYKFNSLAQPAMQEMELLRLKNDNLRQTRDLLLPRLLSGEIEVSSLS